VVSGGFEDVDCAVDVVLVDFFGLLDAFSDASLGGLVIDDIGVSDEFVDGVFVRDRGLNEFVAATRVLCCLAGDFDVVIFDTEIVVGDEVVDDGDIVAAGGKLLGDVAANKSRAAGDECAHVAVVALPCNTCSGIKGCGVA